MSHLHTAVFVLCLLRSVTACHLPFAGEWLLNDRDQLIGEKTIEGIGTCKKARGDEFLFVQNTSRGECHRCLIAFPVHTNVLQYKTTGCIFDRLESVRQCRDYFTGDATIKTLFRKHGVSTACPLDVPLNFTYLTSSGTCSSRVSTIHSCSEKHRLRIQFQSCPEIPKTEAKNDELECIGQWDSPSGRFFAARLYRGDKGDRVTHRCYILDPSSSSSTHGRLGISADASCQELTHMAAATTTLQYKQDLKVYPSCDFPSFLHRDREGKEGRWEGVGNGARHRVHKGTWSVHSHHHTLSHRVCVGRKDVGQVHYVKVHVTEGCDRGWQCIKMRRRRHAALLSFSPITQDEFFSCDEDSMEEERETIVEHGVESSCPSSLRGLHFSPCSDGKKGEPAVDSGCERECEMRLAPSCSPSLSHVQCVTHWREEGTHYAVVKAEGKLYCMVHTPSLFLFYSSSSCDPLSLSSLSPTLSIPLTLSDPCERSLLSGLLLSSPLSSSATHGFIMILFCVLPRIF